MSKNRKPSIKKGHQIASVGALLDLGLMYHKQEHFDLAKQVYQQVLSLSPQHFDALHLMGILAYQASNHGEAIEWFHTAGVASSKLASPTKKFPMKSST